MKRTGEVSNNKHRIDFEGLRTVWRNPVITKGAKVVLLDLLLYAGIDGASFPSEDTLGENHNLSDRQIRNLITELRNNKLLFWIKKGFSSSNAYTFNPEIYFRIGDKDRKPVSAQSGNLFPLQSGNQFPPKVVSNSQLSSSHILQIFENTFKRKCIKSEVQLLHNLCQEFSPLWVKEAIQEAEKRQLEYVSPGYLKPILEDWKLYGKSAPSPPFVPCGQGGCENGFILNKASQTYIECTCRVRHQKELKAWEEKNRRSFLEDSKL